MTTTDPERYMRELASGRLPREGIPEDAAKGILAELDELRARVEQLETTGRALLDALGDHGVPPVRGPVGPIAAAAAEFRAVLDGDPTPADREDPTDA